MLPHVHCSITIAKTWKQLTRPLMDKWIKKMRYIYDYYLAIKKKEILPFATTRMDIMQHEGIMLSEISQRQVRERQMPHYLTYMWSLKHKNKKIPKLIDAEDRSVVARVGGWGVGKMGSNVQTSSSKINKSCGCNVQHGNYS